MKPQIIVAVLFSVIFLSPLIAANLNAPTVYWKFNEEPINRQANDSQGQKNLTLNKTNSAWFHTGKLNNALKLNATANGETTMNVSNGAEFAFGTGTFSVAFWINGTHNSGGSFALLETDRANANGWGLVQDTAETTLKWFTGGSSVFSIGGTLLNNSWHRVWIVREGTGASGTKIYINGINTANTTLSTDLSYATGLFTIKGPNGGSGIYLDDFRIYKGYAATKSDITTDWNDGAGQELTRSVTVTLSSPVNGVNSIQTNQIFQANMTPIFTNITNATLYLYHLNGTLFNKTTNSVTGYSSNSTTWNVSGFLPSTYLWDVYACSMNNTLSYCSVSGVNRTYIWGVINNSETYNTSTYETSHEMFRTNLTVASGLSISSATLYYNGTAYTGTVTSEGSLGYILTRAIDISTGSGTKNWFWSIIYSSGIQQNLSASTQTIAAINLSLCGAAPQHVPYINFTFKDEGTQAAINASVDASTWDYYIGTGSINKTLSYSNTPTNSSYGFCFSPQNKTVNSGLNFKYSASGYPQRTYQPSVLSLTNSTTNTVLYLLSSADGIYSAIQIIDSNNLRPIQNVYVTISRSISGVNTIIEQGYTDSSGLVTFWVNPNFDHTVQASKSGYATSSVTVRPSQTTYTMALTSTESGNASYTSDIQGIKWFFYPRPGTLIPSANTTFGFNVTSAKSNLQACKIELLNASNGAVITSATTTTSTAGSCNVSVAYTPSSGQTLFGRLSLDTTNSTGFFIVDADAKWVLLDRNVTWSNTIVAVWDEIDELNEFGSDGNKTEFSLFIAFFFIFTVLIGLLTFTTGWEINNSLGAILIIWSVVAIGSFAGFFTFDYGSSNLNEKFEKYIVLLIYSLFAGGYVLNQWRRTE